MNYEANQVDIFILAKRRLKTKQNENWTPYIPPTPSHTVLYNIHMLISDANHILTYYIYSMLMNRATTTSYVTV